ncbi:g6186 [Coccomyxa elongata]
MSEEQASKRPRTDDPEDGTAMEDDQQDGPAEEHPEERKPVRRSVQDLMRPYYGLKFPYNEFCQWLSYGNDTKLPQADSNFFQRREFCFTLDGDIFVRYQSFKDKEELRRAMSTKLPAKIDIGPVYNVDPQRRKAYTGVAPERGFMPVERELVFDIDLTDYDDVRTCGKEGHICGACWPLMAVAVEIIDAALREDFGFQHILWVFSGRRGIHCWVCDERARKLTDEQRSALAAFLSVYKGTEGGLARLALSTVSASNHPSVERAYRMLSSAWTEHILPQQRLLEDEAAWESVLAYIKDDDVTERLRARWTREQGRPATGDLSVERWADLESEIDKVLESKSTDRARKQVLARAKKEIVFAYAYPRLDVEVSKKMNHLLKAPFCVHPKTGKVCVPMDPSDIWAFSPDAVTTVHDLIEAERDSQDAASADAAMEAAVQTFRRCFLDGMRTASKASLVAKARATEGLAW